MLPLFEADEMLIGMDFIIPECNGRAVGDHRFENFPAPTFGAGLNFVHLLMKMKNPCCCLIGNRVSFFLRDVCKMFRALQNLVCRDLGKKAVIVRSNRLALFCRETMRGGSDNGGLMLARY